MLLEILTPEKKLFEGEVKSVKFPGTDGGFEVFNNHARISTIRELLITEIAILDNKFEDGRILSDDYYRERAVLSQKLVDAIAVD